MNKKHFLVLSILALAIIWGKPSKRLTGNSIIIKQDPYSSEEIYKLKNLYDAGNHSALDAMIAIYQNKNQSYDIRILCLDLLSNLDNPLIKDALKNSIETMQFLDLEFLAKSINILKNYNDLESTQTLINGLAISENKIMDLRETIVNAIGEIGTKDEIITLLDLYEVSYSNHSRMNELLTYTLGNMDDDRSIPILMDIANNKTINIRIRNTAVEILSRKNAPELVDYFVEMLGDPETNEEMLNFINNSMGDIQNDRMIMALLESYQTGKNRYFANLHSIMSALDDYNNPQIKPTFIEIATTDGFPRLLRAKAIKGLQNFNDVGVLDYLVPILENPDNYEFYFDILDLAKNLNAPENYMNMIRNAAYKAMLNSKGVN
tara:strand:- start:52 stop:1182 length:1131 start_codon:yes stop_codon:yes gene_type:complete